MKFETKQGDNFNSFFLKFKVPFVEKKINFKFLLYNTPLTWVNGYSSRTQQGRYVLFHDYDNLTLNDVVNELKFLQEKFKLSEYYVFKLDRENSFHAVCLDTFSLIEAYNIQTTTSCDLAFIHSIKNLETKEWILRFGKKGERSEPVFCCFVGSLNKNRIKSSAHAILLRKLEVSVSKKGKWDKCKKLGLVKYNTSNRIKGK